MPKVLNKEEINNLYDDLLSKKAKLIEKRDKLSPGKEKNEITKQVKNIDVKISYYKKHKLFDKRLHQQKEKTPVYISRQPLYDALDRIKKKAIEQSKKASTPEEKQLIKDALEAVQLRLKYNYSLI